MNAGGARGGDGLAASDFDFDVDVDVDVDFDEAYFRDPAAAHERLLAAGPIHRAVLPSGEAAWLLVGYEQVRAALTDPRLSVDKRHAGPGYTGLSLPGALDRNLLSLDGADHARLRRLAAPAFTADAVAPLEPRIRATAQGLFEALAAAGGGDLIGEFAAPLARDTLRRLLGVPDGQREAFVAHVETLMSAAAGPDEQRAAGGALLRIAAALVEAKRREPGPDLISALVDARDGEDRLSEDEMLSLVFLLVMAGYETTTALIGTAALALLESGAGDAADAPGVDGANASDASDAVNNAAYAKAADAVNKADSAAAVDTADTVDRLIDRALREQAPAPWSIRRFATCDLTVADTLVRAGEPVLLGLASANADPAAPSERHLSFGHGAHYCLGAPLARFQARIALEVVAAERARIRLVSESADLGWRRSIRIRALETLPVSIKAIN